MRTIMIMFDTLAKNYLPNFGNDFVKAPNFKRLEEKTITFDNYYAGSLPCIPARRELQTGKYNFLHRSWGPLEPFDFSVFEEMKRNDIYTHLCTDHSHYFEDGGATYHNRFNTWEFFRGQEGDRWQAHDVDITIPKRNPLSKDGISVKQHYLNIQKMAMESEMSLAKTVEAGLEFLNNHKTLDNWFLQMECFDPHEPFYVPEKYRKLYHFNDEETMFNWPKYTPIDSEQHMDELADLQANYAALITMCDVYLGKILDYMDVHDLWKDTMLIVNTDHGFLLGEHDWLGKNIPPAYNDIVEIPLFIWHPEIGGAGEHRSALAQSIDLVPTLLESYGLELPDNLDGKSLFPILKNDEKIHDTILFGAHGGAVNITDGRYVYMREQTNASITDIEQYTLMPTVMRGFIPTEYTDSAQLINGGKYSNNHACLSVKTPNMVIEERISKHLLYDLKTDKAQQHPMEDEKIEQEMLEKLEERMRFYDAPESEFNRLGLKK